MLGQLLEDFKKFLDVTGNEYDDILKLILKFSEGFIFETYGVAILERSLEDTVSPKYGGSSVYTPYGYISGVSELSVDGNVLVPATDCFFKRNKVVITNTQVTVTLSSKIDLKYTVGYSDINVVPSGLLVALYILGKKVWNDSTKDTDTLSRVSIDIKEGISTSDDIPTVAKQALEAHRVYRL